MLTENKLIPNLGNRDQMVFVGALANVVVPCDGGRGQHPVIVNYQYFFKDDLHVYTYLSKSEKM